MNDSRILENVADNRNDNDRFSPDFMDFLGFNCKKNVTSRGILELVQSAMLKCLTGGADKVFKDKKSLKFKNRSSSLTSSSHDLAEWNENLANRRIYCNDQSSDDSDERESEDGESKIKWNKVENKKASEKPVFSMFESSEKAANSHSGSYNNGYALNFLAFLTILLTKSIGFQLTLFLSLFTLPIWLSYCSFMFFLFPFQTLSRIRGFFMKMLWKMWNRSCSSVTNSVRDQLTSRKSPIKLSMMMFGRAIFWSSYVCSVLFGLLVLGFVIGSFAMSHLVEEPIQGRETLNFDYTKTSPVVFVPISSSLGAARGVDTIEEAGKPVAASACGIPYNHKLQLTVSLTLPESDYNRNLGVFQVRMELLSASGKVTAASSYPTMLRFKSQPIRFVETFFKTAQLLTGFQSESQTLNIKMNEYAEGLEPTACLKVVLEQRAEYQTGNGGGIPEIYAASLAIESELPQLKRIIWNWRRTVFVWVSFMSFLTEFVFVFVFFRPLIIPRERPITSMFVLKNALDIVS